MAFIISLFIGFSLFAVGQILFRRTPPNPFIDSLRLGKLHYLLLGILFGMFFPEEEAIFRPFETLRYNLMGAILLWIGLQTGLLADIQTFRTFTLPVLTSQTTTIFTTTTFTIVAVLASGSILFRHLGLIDNLPLAIVFITCFALSVRNPEPLFRWANRLLPTPHSMPPPLANLAALSLLTIGFPILAQDPIFYFANQSFLGTGGYLILLIVLSIGGGIALDFAFRSHATSFRAFGLVIGVLISLFGLSQAPGLPALCVGFVSGIWLINTTVAKRDVIELSARADDVIKPIFFVLLGTIIGGFGGGPFFHLGPIIPLALIIILVRGMGRTIGLTISQTIWQSPENWRELFGQSWQPQDTLAVAIGVQALYILQFEHHTLIAGLTLAVFLGQLVLIPPPLLDPNQNRE